MRVAIDGPAGSGKSTVAHALAERENLVLLDTGAMYRAVTLAAVQAGIDVADADALGALASRVRISFGRGEDGSQTVSLDGADVTSAIRTPEIDALVSPVSAVPLVREAMVAQQRELAKGADVVAEGRDIGTVVFPDAEVKVFLTADAKRRAHRRALQRSLSGDEAEQEILAALVARDEADSSRATSPLVAAEDAHHLDSTDMTVEEEVAFISGLIAAARARTSSDATPEEAPATPEPKPEPEPESQPQPQAVPAIDAAAKADAQKASRKPRQKSEGVDEGPMHVFGGNTYDDYYDHPVYEFPITSRCFLGAAVIVCAAASKTLWPWKIENGSYLWDADGGQVIVMNHVSMLEPVIIVVTDWFHGRRCRPIYKSDFDAHRIVSWFFSRVGAIPVDRGKADVKAVRRAQRALMRGEDVLVYPEGTRIHTDDQEVEVHGGFALMAQLAKAPVVPVAIVGARDATPGGNGMPRPHRVHLKAGHPITFDDLPEGTRKQRAKAMEEAAMKAVYSMVDELTERFPKWR